MLDTYALALKAEQALRNDRLDRARRLDECRELASPGAADSRSRHSWLAQLGLRAFVQAPTSPTIPNPERTLS